LSRGAAILPLPLRAALEDLVRRTDVAARIAADPVRFPRRCSKRAEDAEVVAFLAALLAFGRVAAFVPKLEALLFRLGPEPARALREGDPGEIARGFSYRWVRAAELARLLRGISLTLRAEGSLGAAFAAAKKASGDGVRGALSGFRAAIVSRGGRGKPTRAFESLLPDPARGSACKRANLFLRWMARRDDGVDLGLWTSFLPPSELIVPLDTHVARIARYAGLTRRMSSDWATAAEITASLRRVDPDDPVRFDFALCHLGMSGACPTRRKAESCSTCALLASCRRVPSSEKRSAAGMGMGSPPANFSIVGPI
jgi:uncharacterized protein (TIGR02757 family)